MKVLFLTNEYPPHIYGGAGVHVGYLSRELAKMMPVEVRCFGDQRIEEGNLKVTGYEVDTEQFQLPKAVALCFRRGAAMHRFQHHEHRRQSGALSHVVQPFRRDLGEKELRHSARDHSALAGAASPLEARTTRWWLRFFTLG